MNTIENNDQLEVGKYYHCFKKINGAHSIHRCEQDGPAKYFAGRIWACDDNNQTLDRWIVIGPIEVPVCG